MCLGLDMSLIGPTLTALAGQTGTTVGEIGLVFLLGAGGVTLGTLLGGWTLRLGPRPLGPRNRRDISASLLFLVPHIRWYALCWRSSSSRGSPAAWSAPARTLSPVDPRRQGRALPERAPLLLRPGRVPQPVPPGAALDRRRARTGRRTRSWPSSTSRSASRSSSVYRRRRRRRWRAARPVPRAGKGRIWCRSWSRRCSSSSSTSAPRSHSVAGSTTYAVKLGLADAALAAYLTSLFWLAFTIGRLISIPVAIRFSPAQSSWSP